MHLPATAVVAVTATPAMVPTATGVGADREAAEEDDGHDEHHTGDDADPRGDHVEPAVSALVLVRRNERTWWRRKGRFAGRRGGGDGAGSGFGGRGWFGHVPDDRRGIKVSLENRL